MWLVKNEVNLLEILAKHLYFKFLKGSSFELCKPFIDFDFWQLPWV